MVFSQENKNTRESDQLFEARWQEKHPLLKAARSGKEFICFHTHNLTFEHIQKAIEEKRSIEIDVLAIGPWIGDYQEEIVYGHNPWMYLAKGENIPKQGEFKDPKKFIDLISNKHVFVKFDIKSPQALPWVVTQAERILPYYRMLHAFVEDLHAVNFSNLVKNPYIQESSHTASEYVAIDTLKKAKKDLDGIPIQASCRGFSITDLLYQEKNSYPLLDAICQKAYGIFEVVNLNPYYPHDIPKEERFIPDEIIHYIWNKYRIMVELNIDNQQILPEGIPYLGRSDNLEKTTRIVN